YSYAYLRDLHSFPTRRSSDLFHQNRQIPGCFNYVAENAHGTDGSLECINDRTIFNITGKNEWHYTKEDPIVDPYQQEHNDLFKADRKSTRLNSSHRTISYAVF